MIKYISKPLTTELSHYNWNTTFSRETRVIYGNESIRKIYEYFLVQNVTALEKRLTVYKYNARISLRSTNIVISKLPQPLFIVLGKSIELINNYSLSKTLNIYFIRST